MNVTKELLENLGVAFMTLSSGAKDYVCFLRKIQDGVLEFSLLSPPEFSGPILLKIALQNGDGVRLSSVNFVATDFGEDYCTGRLDEAFDENIASFFRKIAALEYQDEKYGRRKEERISIGKERYKDFGLSTPEQTLFVKGIKCVQPCAIIDASVHGICIITRFVSSDFGKVENFNIKISFKNPDETVVLEAHKVHAKLKRTDRSVFALLSCQLLEPISHSWKTRVISLMESLA